MPRLVGAHHLPGLIIRAAVAAAVPFTALVAGEQLAAPSGLASAFVTPYCVIAVFAWAAGCPRAAAGLTALALACLAGGLPGSGSPLWSLVVLAHALPGALAFMEVASLVRRLAGAEVTVDDRGLRVRRGSNTAYWPFEAIGAARVEEGGALLVVAAQDGRALVRLPLPDRAAVAIGRFVAGTIERGVASARSEDPPPVVGAG